MISGKRVLVTGGAGSIGGEIVRQLCTDNTVFVFDINETAYFDLVEELNLEGRIGDIRDAETVNKVVGKFKPDIVFHAAALKHVTLSMQTPQEYVRTNVLGTLNLLHACRDIHKVEKFINISTDKAVNVDNVMGWTKKGTELFTRIFGGVSVRFGNVMGSRGSVIPLWQKQIDKGKPVTVTDARMERYMMSIEEAVELVIQAAEKGEAGDIYILDLEKRRVNVLELAKQIINNAGVDVPIRMIGARAGESFIEHLMSYEEESKARKEGGFYILSKEASGEKVLVKENS